MNEVHPALPGLTRSPLKAELYDREPYFRESYRDLAGWLEATPEAVVHRHALLYVKPDGLALGRATATLQYYAQRGFGPAWAALVALPPTVWRAVWTYQLPQASLDRIAVNDLVMRGRGLLVLLRATTPDVVPAAVRVSALKGPARQERQDPDCLRRVVKQPNRIFSLVHSADEPADVIRELAMFLDTSGRRAAAAGLVAESLDSSSAALLQAIESGDARGSQRTFDPDASSRRICALLEQVASETENSAFAHQARELQTLIQGRDLLPFRQLRDLLHQTGQSVDDWDLAVLGSTLIRDDEPGKSKILENPGLAAWQVVMGGQ